MHNKELFSMEPESKLERLTEYFENMREIY